MGNNHTTTGKPEPVIFRMWRGMVIALFPAWCDSRKGPHMVQSYIRVGGHGSANYSMIVSESRLATEEEYAAMKYELENHYEYTLKMCKRRTKQHRIEANKMWKSYQYTEV